MFLILNRLMRLTIIVLMPIYLCSMAACGYSNQHSSIKDNEIDIQEAHKVQIDNLMSSLREDFQYFTISCNDPVTVKGKSGILLFINPNDFLTEDDKLPADSLVVEILEMRSTGDFIRNNIHTISNGRLLESGGAYFISIKCGDKKIKLKSGRSVKVYFPKYSDKKMDLFLVSNDSMNNFNWILEGSLTSENDGNSIYKLLRVNGNFLDSGSCECCDELDRFPDAEYMKGLKQRGYESYVIIDSLPIGFDKYYGVYDLVQFGYYNVDRYVDQNKEVALNLKFCDDSEPNVTLVFISNTQTNSVIKIYANNCETLIRNLPINEEVAILAIKIIDGSEYMCYRKIKLHHDMEVALSFKKTNASELLSLIEGLREFP